MGTGTVDAPATPLPDPQPSGRPPAGAEIAAAAPMAVAVFLLFLASWYDGAFALRSWGPLALVVLVAVALLPYGRPSRPALVFAAAFAGLAAWTLASALWSSSPGTALEGGARAALYAALVALPVMTLRSRGGAVWMGRILSAGAGVMVALTLAATASGATEHFLAGRLNDPMGYRNGTAALFALCFWPLLAAAAQRRLHPLARATAFALAVAALGFAYLTQSRGVLIGFACGAVVALAFGPDRLRRAWLTIVAVGFVAVASGRLLEPWDAYLASKTTDAAAVASALSTLRWVVLAAFLVALLAAVLDGGLRIAERTDRLFRGIATGALALVTVAAVAGGLAVAGNPVSLVERKVDEFKQVEVSAPGESRLGSTGGQRYDLWRIAWREFEASPLTGGGEGSYPVRYYRERSTDRNLNTPHSLPLQVLGELGLVGIVLLLGGLAAAAVALVRGFATASPDERRWASALAAAGAVALGQSTVDWLWLIPGLTGLGLVSLATAVAIVSLPRTPERARRPRWGTAAVRVPVVAAAVIVALLSLSDAYVRTARGAGSEDRLEAARSAQRLNPYALAPRYLRAGALEELGRRGQARAALLDALEVEPESFVTLGLLGDLETRAGNTARARRYYARALALNPGDVGLQQLAR